MGEKIIWGSSFLYRETIVINFLCSLRDSLYKYTNVHMYVHTLLLFFKTTRSLQITLHCVTGGH